MTNNGLYHKIVKFGLVDVPNYVFSLDISKEHESNRERVRRNSAAYFADIDPSIMAKNLKFDYQMEVTRKFFRYGKYIIFGSSLNRFANGHIDGFLPLFAAVPLMFVESYMSNEYKQDQEEKDIKEQMHMKFGKSKKERYSSGLGFGSLDDLFGNPNITQSEMFGKPMSDEQFRVLLETIIGEAFKTFQQNAGFNPTIMQQKNPYDVLGIPRTATEKEIKTAYRNIAKECHPDLNPGDAEKESRFKEASSAYESLTKPNGRY